MARTPSTMPPLGASMPAFRRTDQVSGQTVDSQSLFGNPILVMFICNHCPFVVHVMDEMIALANDFVSRGGRVAGHKRERCGAISSGWATGDEVVG